MGGGSAVLNEALALDLLRSVGEPAQRYAYSSFTVNDRPTPPDFDDMAGPGRNYYLWLDTATGRFRVVAWDHNLTFGGAADQGPFDAGRMGGRMGGHRLKERALAGPAFKVVYERAYRDLYRRLYAGAQALSTLDSIVKVLGTVGGSDPAATASDAERLRTLLVARTQSLAEHPVITG
ncbi:CotH kinase family protein [Dactylosporangium sp. NPDC000521]|uniref:CotH kinase family protein n=1 Tax=Dactylosporangium sp. NPDC000521 TaxID=3363975 RepID=UPI0036936374